MKHASLALALLALLGTSACDDDSNVKGDPGDRDGSDDSGGQDASSECNSPVIYDEALCESAPSVGFCIVEDMTDEALEFDGVTCGGDIPDCDGDATSCQYQRESDLPCTGSVVEKYNDTICDLIDAGLVDDGQIQSIPAD